MVTYVVISVSRVAENSFVEKSLATIFLKYKSCGGVACDWIIVSSVVIYNFTSFIQQLFHITLQSAGDENVTFVGILHVYWQLI